MPRVCASRVSAYRHRVARVLAALLPTRSRRSHCLVGLSELRRRHSVRTCTAKPKSSPDASAPPVTRASGFAAAHPAVQASANNNNNSKQSARGTAGRAPLLLAVAITQCAAPAPGRAPPPPSGTVGTRACVGASLARTRGDAHPPVPPRSLAQWRTSRPPARSRALRCRCVAPRKFRGENHFAAICLQAPNDAPRGRWASFEAPAPRLGGVGQQPSTPQVRTRTHHTCAQALEETARAVGPPEPSIVCEQ